MAPGLTSNLITGDSQVDRHEPSWPAARTQRQSTLPITWGPTDLWHSCSPAVRPEQDLRQDRNATAADLFNAGSTSTKALGATWNQAADASPSRSW